MPYVRQHGNQLELVHGIRNARGSVEQRVLFTLYSKPEALEAVGKGSRLFQALLEAQYPDLKFSWSGIERAIRDKLGALPDSYEYAADRVRAGFRKALAEFVMQLAHANPVTLEPAALTIREHRHELAWLVDLIQGRLKCADRKPNDFTSDNEYFWRSALRGSEMPPEEFEYLEDLFAKGKLDETQALCRLFLEAFGEDADLHNYLGLVALEQGRTEQAIAEFRETVRLGRRSVPKRISKKSFCDDFRARPYLRGLTNLASALNLAGEFEAALAVLDQLEGECGDDFTANSWRAIIYVNTGEWAKAEQAGQGFHSVPSESLPASLALYELGRLEDCAVHAFHAALNNPRASCMLHELRAKQPTSATEAQDWNEGVHLTRHLHAYLDRRTRRSKDFFRKILKHPRVVALQRQVEDAEGLWRSSKTREGFATMNRLRSLEFAHEEAHKVFEGRHHGRNR